MDQHCEVFIKESELQSHHAICAASALEQYDGMTAMGPRVRNSVQSVHSAS